MEISQQYSQYQLLLAFDYKKNRRQEYVIYDAALLAVDSYDDYRIVDSTGLKYPLTNAYWGMIPTNISTAAFQHNTLSDLNKKINSIVTRLGIKTVWVYTDAPVLRKLWSLRATDINVVALRYGIMGGTIASIDMNSDSGTIIDSPEEIKMMFTVMTNLVAGYSLDDHILYYERENVIPCDAHRFAIPDDKYLCAATLVTINRLVLLMTHKFQSYGKEECNIILKRLLLKMLSPYHTTWKYNTTSRMIETNYDGTISTDGIVYKFKEYLNNVGHVNHMGSDMLENVMALLGYKIQVYQHVIYIP